MMLSTYINVAWVCDFFQAFFPGFMSIGCCCGSSETWYDQHDIHQNFDSIFIFSFLNINVQIFIRFCSYVVVGVLTWERPTAEYQTGYLHLTSFILLKKGAKRKYEKKKVIVEVKSLQGTGYDDDGRRHVLLCLTVMLVERRSHSRPPIWW